MSGERRPAYLPPWHHGDHPGDGSDPTVLEITNNTSEEVHRVNQHRVTIDTGHVWCLDTRRANENLSIKHSHYLTSLEEGNVQVILFLKLSGGYQ